VNLERTLDKRRRKVEVVRRRQLNYGHHFAEGDDQKKVSFLRKK